MIGFNGGLIGADRTTNLTGAVGVWTPGEQIKARRTNIWPVLVTADPFYSSVSLLLHGDGANGSTTFTDNSPRVKIVANNYGNIISTTQSYFPGLSSIFCNNTHMTYTANTDFELGSGDFTIECWYRGTTGADFSAIVSKGLFENTSGAYALHFRGGSNLLGFYLGSTDNNVITSTTNIKTSGVWNHVAVSRIVNSTKMFINGIQEGSTYAAAYTIPTGGILSVGKYYYGYSGDSVTGYIDDLRITKGVGRYNTNFALPTAPFSNA